MEKSSDLGELLHLANYMWERWWHHNGQCWEWDLSARLMLSKTSSRHQMVSRWHSRRWTLRNEWFARWPIITLSSLLPRLVYNLQCGSSMSKTNRPENCLLQLVGLKGTWVSKIWVIGLGLRSMRMITNWCSIQQLVIFVGLFVGTSTFIFRMDTGVWLWVMCHSRLCLRGLEVGWFPSM